MVADRVAQAGHLMDRVDPVFHEDSYGYWPGRSALDAVESCRQRCWRKDWVVELDIEKFFDSVRSDLIVKAMEAHTDAVWVILYVKRWLQAPLQLPDGTCTNGLERYADDAVVHCVSERQARRVPAKS
jgi:RNA-directed DNA polymerase